MDGVDLVIREYNTKNYLRPLGIKLTVRPDSTTFEKSKNEWGCEIVIRPSTMEYLALSLYEST